MMMMMITATVFVDDEYKIFLEFSEINFHFLFQNANLYIFQCVAAMVFLSLVGIAIFILV